MNLINKKTLVLSSLLTLAVSLTACGEKEQPAPSTPAKTEAPAPSEPAKTEATPEQEQAPAEQPAPAESATPAPAEQTEAPKEEAAAAAPKETALAADAGQKRYETTCKVCHDTGMLDAPKVSDKANWETRAKQGKDTLYTHATKGFNKMPAQATGDISEAEVKAAVDYMLSKAGV